MITIKHLFLAFTKEFDALHDINLEVADGEKIALVGEADSGKTMLLRVLAKLENFKKGEVCIKNIDIKKVNFKQDCSVGFVPKSFVFFENKTLKYNLEYILKSRNYDLASINLKVLTALKQFDLESLAEVKVKDLSPFQKILAELARVSMRKIDLYLIDDVCSLVYGEEQQKIIQKLADLMWANQQSTFVFAFVNQQIANQLGLKIINLKYGEIVNDQQN